RAHYTFVNLARAISGRRGRSRNFFRQRGQVRGNSQVRLSGFEQLISTLRLTVRAVLDLDPRCALAIARVCSVPQLCHDAFQIVPACDLEQFLATFVNLRWLTRQGQRALARQAQKRGVAASLKCVTSSNNRTIQQVFAVRW